VKRFPAKYFFCLKYFLMNIFIILNISTYIIF
jgi:hypothetical protein